MYNCEYWVRIQVTWVFVAGGGWYTTAIDLAPKVTLAD